MSQSRKSLLSSSFLILMTSLPTQAATTPATDFSARLQKAKSVIGKLSPDEAINAKLNQTADTTYDPDRNFRNFNDWMNGSGWNDWNNFSNS